MNADVSEKKDSLLMLAASPMIWAAHFAISYAIASIHCAKLPTASFAPARIAIAIVTCVSLAGIAFIGLRGFARHRLGGAPPPHDADTPASRHRFLGFATALLSGLSATAIVFETLAVVLVARCT